MSDDDLHAGLYTAYNDDDSEILGISVALQSDRGGAFTDATLPIRLSRRLAEGEYESIAKLNTSIWCKKKRQPIRLDDVHGHPPK
jgi:hypothetical protein